MFTAGCLLEGNPPVSYIYESCRSVYDCERAADDCVSIFLSDGAFGRMCTNYCNPEAADPDATCLDGGVCYALESDIPPICYAPCTDANGLPDDRYCDLNFECAQIVLPDDSVDYVCLPY